MAEKYWYGNGSTEHTGEWNFDDSGNAYAESNWRLCSDDSGCAKPAAGDVVRFDNRAAYNDDSRRYQDVTSGVDAVSTGTPDLASLIVTADYDGNIASASGYLELQCSAGDVILAGSGSIALKVSGGAAADAAIHRLIANSDQGTICLAGAVNDASNVALLENVLVFAGEITIADSTAISKLQVLNESAKATVGTACGNVKTDTEPTVTVAAGDCDWASSAAQIEVISGTLTWAGDSSALASGLAIDLLIIHAMGKFNWQTATSDAAVLKKFVNYGGTLDAARSTNSQYAKQIGSGAGEISEAWYNSRLRCGNKNGNLTFAAGSTIKTHDATLYPPAAAQIDW